MSAAPGRRRSIHDVHEEHENHERWLITYADMITLLMVLFIVLFAMSQIDVTKYNALKASLSASFHGQSKTVLQGSESLLAHPGETAVSSIAPQTSPNSPRLSKAYDDIKKQVEAEADRQAYQAALAEANTLLALQRKVNKALAAEGLQQDAVTEVTRDGLRISLVSRHIVFAADRAELSARGQKIIAVLVPVLNRIDNTLRIEGHTNQAPGKPKFYASDWDLSTARAVTVLRELNERFGIASTRLSAVGYGKTRPLLPITDPDSQIVNKRVDIVVQPKLGSEQLSLLERAIAEQQPRA